MYQQCYAEVIEDDQTAARQIEFEALDRVVALLAEADRAGPRSKEGVKALYVTRQLWTLFITELARDDNALPHETRANLISIGIWILKEADAIRLGESVNYAGIADICSIVRDGLR